MDNLGCSAIFLYKDMSGFLRIAHWLLTSVRNGSPVLEGNRTDHRLYARGKMFLASLLGCVLPFAQ